MPSQLNGNLADDQSPRVAIAQRNRAVRPSRREMLVASAAAALAPTPRRSLTAAPAAPRLGIGFSLYGMKSLPLEQALTACREIGYDSVELPVMVDWPADSARLDAASLRRLRDVLQDTGLRLAGLMENLTLSGSVSEHSRNLERLRAAARVGHALVPEQPPVIETILGGRPERWEEVRESFRDRLRDWASVAAEERCVIAIKPHVAGALHTPEGAAWLIQHVDRPQIRVAFDYSHFQLRERTLGECLDRLLPITAFIHVKDARGTPAQFQFLLPGEGTIDYSAYWQQLARAGFTGDLVVEVSGQIHSRPDYDPRAAARRSYAALAGAAEAAGIRRR